MKTQNTAYEGGKQLKKSRLKSLDEIEVGEPVYDSLFDYYVDSGEMPYGTMKARDGAPCEWITYRVADLDILKEETV